MRRIFGRQVLSRPRLHSHSAALGTPNLECDRSKLVVAHLQTPCNHQPAFRVSLHGGLSFVSVKSVTWKRSRFGNQCGLLCEARAMQREKLGLLHGVSGEGDYHDPPGNELIQQPLATSGQFVHTGAE